MRQLVTLAKKHTSTPEPEILEQILRLQTEGKVTLTEPPIKTSSKNLDSIERIALSVGMSLALVPITGLIVNYTPYGMRLTPIVLSLLILTIAFATAGIIREHKSQLMKKT